MKNDGRLSSGRASAWTAAWLETQGFFLLFAILRPTLFTGKRGLYFKSETWTKSLVVEFWKGKGSNSIIQARLSLFTHQAKASRSTLEGFLFSRNTWNVLWLFRLRKKWWANLLCGTWRKPRCVGIYALLKYSPSYCPCSVQGITTHFKDLLYYHQKMFAQISRKLVKSLFDTMTPPPLLGGCGGQGSRIKVQSRGPF